MIFLDNMIEKLSPSWALDRYQARMKLRYSKRHFEGASHSDRMKSWTPVGNRTSLDTGALDLMASRVSYLYDNSAPIKRGINAISNYVFGAGCVPHAIRASGKKHDSDIPQ